MRRMIALGCVVTLLLTGSALADWDPGDDHKMHYPQLPDPNGWDVNFTGSTILADDWQCSETGSVSDIHFWLSSRQDMPFDLLDVYVAIHTDDISGPFSKPGELLWDATFQQGAFTIRTYGQGLQGWYDPNLQEVVPDDHTLIYQVNITDIPDPFLQEEGTVYWLDLDVFALGPAGPAQLGWKTTLDHFRDDAVWAFDPTNGIDPTGGEVILAQTGLPWQPLVDPFTGATLDLAFVITGEPVIVPEPAGLGLLGLSLLAVRKRRR